MKRSFLTLILLCFIVSFANGQMWKSKPNFNFGAELNGRYSSSENLDGYTSQYSSSNDVYYFFNFTITYKMKTSSKDWPSFN